MTDADNLRSGLEVSLLRVERDRGDALAGIVERCLSHLATMGSEDSASEVALIEARGCLASALRRDDGRPLAVLVTEVRDILDACRAALGMEPTEWATEIVAQIDAIKAARKKEAGEYWEMTRTVKADADRWRAERAVEVEGLNRQIDALSAEVRRLNETPEPSPGPWVLAVNARPLAGEWVLCCCSTDGSLPWLSHWDDPAAMPDSYYWRPIPSAWTSVPTFAQPVAT